MRHSTEEKLARNMGARVLVSPQLYEPECQEFLNHLSDPASAMSDLLDFALRPASFRRNIEKMILPTVRTWTPLHPARELAALTQNVVCCFLADEPELCFDLLGLLNEILVDLAIEKKWTVSTSAPLTAINAASYPGLGTQHPSETVYAYKA